MDFLDYVLLCIIMYYLLSDRLDWTDRGRLADASNKEVAETQQCGRGVFAAGQKMDGWTLLFAATGQETDEGVWGGTDKTHLFGGLVHSARASTK